MVSSAPRNHAVDLLDRYLWFIGRADDVIKSSGYRIGPFEVESALLQHPAVVECAVTGVPDEARGQVVKASVVLAAGCRPTPALASALQQHVKRVTEPYKYPRIIEFVDQLPKTISGKVRRTEIRDRDREPPPTPPADLMPAGGSDSPCDRRC
jgi:acetyl-CoA synthetase